MKFHQAILPLLVLGASASPVTKLGDLSHDDTDRSDIKLGDQAHDATSRQDIKLGDQAHDAIAATQYPKKEQH
ncbi:hypothetical protein H634G_09725 [Metarhizium anisopliae BRIP 53293]|uniref:Uncharacterized protein n=1 Tax=Metarhizium anisopliae BRIP 53293 TaxID=1291518 RepID=A0A0D9NR67_METAN|nr:hypothetical protein H634G_09725 [Metarhizium anisopliae BRIP 53293]KJK86486.1 hypothetical protein H633G_09660 [Metarhizium anisopliae BRIP 53284]